MENDSIKLNREQLKTMLWDSQRCQRNWDLSKSIPDEDLELLIHAIKSSPSKQNEKHFKVYAITNYDIRKNIYDNTKNFAHDADGISMCFNQDGTINYKNQSQLIGNVLFVFCREKNDIYRSGESFSGGKFSKEDMNVLRAGTVDMSTAEKKKAAQDKLNSYALQAIGISVGYLILTAHMLGYKTGCSSGFDGDSVVNATGNDYPETIVAVGFDDKNRNRLEEHFEPHRLFPSFNKDIDIEWIK